MIIKAVHAPNGQLMYNCSGFCGRVYVSTVGRYRWIALQKALLAIYMGNSR
jgi:hypothetical protein